MQSRSIMPTKQRKQVRKGIHGGMQLVLTEDVTHLGKQGELVEVKAGYGRNYLLPRGLATVPTEHNLKLLGRYKIKVKQAHEAKIADLKGLAGQILRESIIVEANANEEGHLYGSVGPAQLAQALRAKNLQVDSAMVRMEGPITEIGIFGVKLVLGHDMEGKEIECDVKVGVIRPVEKK
jgi:large subunit ribosomal protein L9